MKQAKISKSDLKNNERTKNMQTRPVPGTRVYPGNPSRVSGYYPRNPGYPARVARAYPGNPRISSTRVYPGNTRVTRVLTHPDPGYSGTRKLKLPGYYPGTRLERTHCF